MKNTTLNKTIGEIVALDYRTAEVFKNYGLDFCCGGGKTLNKACERKGINEKAVLNDLATVTVDRPADNYKDWSLDFLIDYIVQNHHHFVRRKLPEIKEYAKKVAKVHGKTYPELKQMLTLFVILKDELLIHLEKEEELLFPYIKDLTKLQEEGKSLKDALISKRAEESIRMMKEEHEEAGEILDKMAKLSNDFTPPKDDCTTFRVYFQNLKAFRDDLHKHIHLENNILFPQVLEIEKCFN